MPWLAALWWSADQRSPAYGKDGQPFTWNPARMPIQYRVDPGPFSMNPAGTVYTNADGLVRVHDMFAVWQSVPTAALSFTDAGQLLPAGSYTGGDLLTTQQYNDIEGSCNSGTQSPVIFDADGAIIADLGLPPEIIGFAGMCKLDAGTGYILTAELVLNGEFQDSRNHPEESPPNYELSLNQFDEVIVHEIGHFIGLDHSQINLHVLTSNQYPCDVDELAGLPLMFPELLCQARKDVSLPVLAPDDVAWISTLYPGPSYASSYGTISGRILFSDGISQVQGANVIARLVDDPNTPQDESRRVVVSAISGYLFTANPGQSVTASMSDPTEDNTNGWKAGSRNPQLIGYYRIPVPPGTYTVEVESIYSGFISESGIGPLSPPVPIPAEFWNERESAFDPPAQRDTVTVHPRDNITNVDIILNGQQARYDQYEDTGAVFDPPPPARLPGGRFAAVGEEVAA